MKAKLKGLITSLRPLILAIGICLIVYASFLLVKGIWLDMRSEMKTSHVYVSDNPEHNSDFDEWLKENAVTMNDDGSSKLWVPTYLIIKNGAYIGKFRGDISETEFSEKLATIVNFNMPVAEFPNYAITNLDDERKTLSEIFGKNGVIIMEIHWIDCPDCKHQDEEYTNDIYAKYSADMFYRYYIRSDKNKVLEKYSKN